MSKINLSTQEDFKQYIKSITKTGYNQKQRVPEGLKDELSNLDANINVNDTSSTSKIQGPTFLSKACANNWTDIAEILLNKGANPNILPSAGFSPLGSACKWRNLELVKLLLEKGANPNIGGTGRAACSNLKILFEGRLDVDIIKLLCKYGASFNSSNYEKEDFNLLKFINEQPRYIKKMYNEVLKYIENLHSNQQRDISNLESQINLSTQEKFQEYLMNFKRNGYVCTTSVPQGLKNALSNLDSSIDINCKSKGQNLTLLSKACANNWSDIVELLLNKGADPSIISSNGFSPLGSACKWRNLELVKLLLEKGANPNIGGTGRAACSNLKILFEGRLDVDIIKLLCKYGASFNSSNYEKKGFNLLEFINEQPNDSDIKKMYNEVLEYIKSLSSDTSVDTSNNNYSCLALKSSTLPNDDVPNNKKRPREVGDENKNTCKQAKMDNYESFDDSAENDFVSSDENKNTCKQAKMDNYASSDDSTENDFVSSGDEAEESLVDNLEQSCLVLGDL